MSSIASSTGGRQPEGGELEAAVADIRDVVEEEGRRGGGGWRGRRVAVDLGREERKWGRLDLDEGVSCRS